MEDICWFERTLDSNKYHQYEVNVKNEIVRLGVCWDLKTIPAQYGQSQKGGNNDCNIHYTPKITKTLNIRNLSFHNNFRFKFFLNISFYLNEEANFWGGSVPRLLN